MEKVKVNKELFDFLEHYNLKDENDVNFIHIIKNVIDGEILNGINPRMFLDCIYYGYELEETKEEKLIKYFIKNKEYGANWEDGACEGVLKTLEILDIKIKGINE